MVMSGRVWQGNNGEGTEVHGDVEQLGGAREQRMLGGGETLTCSVLVPVG